MLECLILVPFKVVDSMPEYQSRRDTKYTNSKHLLGNDIKTYISVSLKFGTR